MEAAQVRVGPARPGLRPKKVALIARIAAIQAAGGAVWFGDETTVRELPPLRAAWARRGQQRVVLISGRNARRVLHGALNVRTGTLVRVVRERNRQADACAFLLALGQHCTEDAPTLLVWDHNPPHKPRRVQRLAAALGIELAWLPFRSPELNPCEDLWRQLKAEVAANRVYPQVDHLAAHATCWLDSFLPTERRRLAALDSSKFLWIPT